MNSSDSSSIAIVPIILLLIVISALIFLQIFLSKMKNKWAGLVIPVAYACLMPLIFIYSDSFLVLLFGVLEIVSLIIYFVFQKKNKKNSEIDRMSIQDLD